MERGIFEIVGTESLVPEGHLLRKIDAAVDFNKIYDMVNIRVTIPRKDGTGEVSFITGWSYLMVN